MSSHVQILCAQPARKGAKRKLHEKGGHSLDAGRAGSVINFSGKKRALNVLFGETHDTMFLLDKFSTAPCVLHGNSARCDWLREVLYDFDLLQILENTASEEIHVWLKNPQGGDALSSIKVADAKQAHLLYIAGHSLYCRAPAFLEDMIVPAMLKDFAVGSCNLG